MAQRGRQLHHQRQANRRLAPTPIREPVAVIERKPPVVYGKVFIVAEDEQKRTFTFERGAWVPYAQTIAECKKDCQVKELAQKVNKMTRYEVRSPLA